MREGDTRTVSGAGQTFGNGLVVAEIALAFALLVGAGLLVKNLVLLRQRDAGIRTERIVAFDVRPAGERYAQPERQIAFYHELYERLAAVSGVQSVGMTTIGRGCRRHDRVAGFVGLRLRSLAFGL